MTRSTRAVVLAGVVVLSALLLPAALTQAAAPGALSGAPRESAAEFSVAPEAAAALHEEEEGLEMAHPAGVSGQESSATEAAPASPPAAVAPALIGQGEPEDEAAAAEEADGAGAEEEEQQEEQGEADAPEQPEGEPAAEEPEQQDEQQEQAEEEKPADEAPEEQGAEDERSEARQEQDAALGVPEEDSVDSDPRLGPCSREELTALSQYFADGEACPAYSCIDTETSNYSALIEQQYPGTYSAEEVAALAGVLAACHCRCPVMQCEVEYIAKHASPTCQAATQDFCQQSNSKFSEKCAQVAQQLPKVYDIEADPHALKSPCQVCDAAAAPQAAALADESLPPVEEPESPVVPGASAAAAAQPAAVVLAAAVIAAVAALL